MVSQSLLLRPSRGWYVQSLSSTLLNYFLRILKIFLLGHVKSRLTVPSAITAMLPIIILYASLHCFVLGHIVVLVSQVITIGASIDSLISAL